jgi:hypothetical protein
MAGVTSWNSRMQLASTPFARCSKLAQTNEAWSNICAEARQLGNVEKAGLRPQGRAAAKPVVGPTFPGDADLMKVEENRAWLRNPPG